MPPIVKKSPADRIALVGLMGSGKTTVGRLLARRLGFLFVDTDAEAARLAGKSLVRIFAEDGEAAFRGCESQVLRRLSRRRRIVVATGGGIVTGAGNRALLAREFRTYWLAVSAAEAWRRIGSARGRPLLARRPLGRLRGLARERNPSYASVGIRVPTGRRSAAELARTIAADASTRSVDRKVAI